MTQEQTRVTIERTSLEEMDEGNPVYGVFAKTIGTIGQCELGLNLASALDGDVRPLLTLSEAAEHLWDMGESAMTLPKEIRDSEAEFVKAARKVKWAFGVQDETLRKLHA